MKPELRNAYDDLKILTPGRVKEEIVLNGCFFTVARVTVDVTEPPTAHNKLFIVAEGASKRSGDVEPDEPNSLGKVIALGRARTAMAKKLASKHLWTKIHNNLEA